MPPRTFSTRATRAVLIARAVVAIAAALVITFVQERDGSFSLLVLALFAAATGVVLLAGRRWVLAAVHLATAVLAVVPLGDAGVRFHVLLLGWAIASGLVELVPGIRRRGTAGAAEMAVVGGLTLLLAVVSLIVEPQYALDYFIEDAGRSFTLTGTIIGVGIFGGWAALVGVYLAIGALSPAPAQLSKEQS
ncbi:hypothetical protein [Microbacterium indicum]|uniref:hypothetical protein n=1 Tax=Microbacterium indicum TaxID=358100 RepID=UPI0004118AB7|nr:hypothetical protein [Microbacterium indicum]